MSTLSHTKDDWSLLRVALLAHLLWYGPGRGVDWQPHATI